MTRAPETPPQPPSPAGRDRRRVLPALAAAGAAVAGPVAGSPRRDGPGGRCCPIVELRQYTLHAGRRDTLIDLFDREFILGQEAAGVRVIGQFRDLDDPDRFVWMRGFADLESRGRALAAFYGGPDWRRSRAAANATMLDSDNVLLLRPAEDGGGFALDGMRRGGARGLLAANLHYLDADAVQPFAAFFEQAMKPAIAAAGGRVAAAFVTHDGPNSFPALPIRAGEHVLVWFAGFADAAAHARFAERLRAGQTWREKAAPQIFRQLARKPEVLRLVPTSGSLLGA